MYTFELLNLIFHKMSRFGDFLCFLGKDHFILQCSWIIVLFFICFGINYTNAAGFNQGRYNLGYNFIIKINNKNNNAYI